MLHLLRKSIDEPGYHIKPDEGKKKKFANTSRFQLRDMTIEQLSNAFARLYPNIYKELEDVKEDLPNKLEIMRKEIEQFRCPHEFRTSLLKNEKQFKCCNCGYKITVPHSKIETNKQKIEKLNKLKPNRIIIIIAGQEI